MAIDTPDFNEISPQKRMQDVLLVIYRIALEYGAIITTCCLFRCYLSASNALQDVHKFEHTHTFLYFLHFLEEYGFFGAMCAFILALTELLLFVKQYRRASQSEPLQSSILYFTVVLILHVVLWIYTNFFFLPSDGISTAVRAFKMECRIFANETISPAIVYFVVYLFFTLKVKNRHFKKSS